MRQIGRNLIAWGMESRWKSDQIPQNMQSEVGLISEVLTNVEIPPPFHKTRKDGVQLLQRLGRGGDKWKGRAEERVRIGLTGLRVA
jgi:hypothetical protein